MANLQVRDIDDKLYKSLKRRAEIEHRSISQEVVMILEKYLQRENPEIELQTLEFLKLSKSWQDKRDTEVIIRNLRSARSKNKREKMLNELFD
ncbi:FitA-like ribbon-helix-helix domain-containing protein [Leptospira interrogans]|uniref:FitA-like ribbon-helix-helix domain-containing protein n=1 Tax=Leptospira interrogans TaxID=173 RepID=UPI000347E6ED|nr:antitoxin [Leptospira interrogans]